MKIKDLTEKDKGRRIIYDRPGYISPKSDGILVNWNNKLVIVNFGKCSPVMVHLDPKYVEFK